MQSLGLCRVERTQAHGGNGVHAQGNGLAQHFVHVPGGEQLRGMPVVAAKSAAVAVAGGYQRGQGGQIAGSRAIAQKDAAAAHEILVKFFCGGAFVGVGNAGAQVGIKLPAQQGGGVTVNGLAA